MAFDEHQLDEIRGRIKVSEVVGSYFKLIKKGGSEYAVADNPSFTVNDKKNFWCEFGAGGDGKPHDVFDFMQTYGGLTFVGAVEELARRTGVALKQRPGRSGVSSPRSNGAGQPEQRLNGVSHHIAEVSPDDRIESRVGEPTARSKREIISEWDYLSPENELLYQTVRMQERLPDGTWKLKDGKIAKTFLHRRPVGDGTWILGLDVIDRQSGEPLEFVKTEKGTAWLRATEERLAWRNVTRRTFAELGNVEHWLYNANSVIDELQEPKEDQRTILLPEGEGKVDVLREWGLLAVTNSGGAKNFTTACAEFFRGARHVVMLQDNDRAGTERVAKIGPMLKDVGVELIQALNFRDVWPSCPVKGDVKDWRDQGGGTKEQLLEIVDQLKPWTPEPYKSKFGAVQWRDRYKGTTRAYDWAIKSYIPRGKSVLIYGESQSGKSFQTYDMCMAIARGQPFDGKKTQQLGVIYCAAEKGEAFLSRMHAYDKHHGLPRDDDLPFAVLTKSLDLWSADQTTDILIQEIVELSKDWNVPLGVVALDTYQAATPGASIIKDEDVTTMYKRAQRIMEKTGAGVWFVHHKNAHGTIRGSLVLWNAIETTIEIGARLKNPERRDTSEMTDDDNRVIRRAKIRKQSEGIAGSHWDFVLRQVIVGKDVDGDDVTSCVCDDPAQSVPDTVIEETKKKGERPDGRYLIGSNVDVFVALLKAVELHGHPPPKELGLEGVSRVVNWKYLGREYKKTEPREEGESLEKYGNRMKARTRRFREELSRGNYPVIKVAEMVDPDGVNDEPDKPPKVIHFIWPTGLRVYGKGLQWPPIAKKKEKPSLLAPGETIDELSKVF